MTSGDGSVNPRAIKKLAHIFKENGYDLYAVGGSVRNAMLGFPATDQDVASAMPPEEVMGLCALHKFFCIPKGLKYGTVEIAIGTTHVEHTTFRGDVYGTEGGHKPEHVDFTDSLEEDAFRRDLTVNAMYQNILTGEIIDPTGGMLDLRDRLLRATGRPPDLIMRDDAVRILRLARFAAELAFNVDGATYMAAKNHVGGLVYITPERVQNELTRLLLADVKYGYGDVLAGLELLDGLGALDILMPELTLGRNIPQDSRYHAYDVLTHSLMSAAWSKPILEIRLAALLHDVGKPVAFMETGRFGSHDTRGAEIAFNILKRLRYKNSICNNVAELIDHHMFDVKGHLSVAAVRVFMARRGYALGYQLADLREADVHGAGLITGRVQSADKWRTIMGTMQRDNTPVCERDICCTGRDIRNWTGAQGDDIGKVKAMMLDYLAVQPWRNNKRDLRKFCDTYVEGVLYPEGRGPKDLPQYAIEGAPLYDGTTVVEGTGTQLQEASE